VRIFVTGAPLRRTRSPGTRRPTPGDGAQLSARRPLIRHLHANRGGARSARILRPSMESSTPARAAGPPAGRDAIGRRAADPEREDCALHGAAAAIADQLWVGVGAFINHRSPGPGRRASRAVRRPLAGELHCDVRQPRGARPARRTVFAGWLVVRASTAHRPLSQQVPLTGQRPDRFRGEAATLPSGRLGGGRSHPRSPRPAAPAPTPLAAPGGVTAADGHAARLDRVVHCNNALQ
jgi:hypothetical protein